MRKFFAPAAMLLLLLSIAVPAYSQGLYSNVSGTVTDRSGALIPGVTIMATNVDQGTVATTVTNEAGVYNYGDLLPGRYTISASLPGFQTKTLTDVNLSQNTTYRYNFELAVASVNTQLEVSIPADTILAAQGATVGQVLSQQKVQDLPLVGNNILDLITVMAGVENIVPTNPPTAANAFGRENTTFAGVRADNVTVVRDGIQMQDARNPNGIYSITTINPDLVGEIRLILAPVDVEMGRGNGSIQYTTRSGTNRFSGSAVWSVRNSALDPNSWSNNRNQTLKLNQPADYYTRAQQGIQKLALEPVWSNTQQMTVSYGGPIIRNKTFFYALFDFNSNRKRTLDNFIVLTPCARLGIFRYFNNWNSTNINGTETSTGANPTRRAVGPDGAPILPSGPPPAFSSVGYDTTVQHRSVFGPLASQPTKNDCSDAPINKTTLAPTGVSATSAPGAGGGWDAFRHQLDPSGYISRAMAYTPLPNNYEIGDGLNTAGFRWLRHPRGIDNLFGSGEATGLRKQINVKIDHNFTSSHKANVNVSYERVLSDDFFMPFPDTFSSVLNRFPAVVSGGLTSTLSPFLLNEARFGFRFQATDQVGPQWRPEYQDAMKDLLVYVNGFRVVPTFSGAFGICNPHGGLRVRETNSDAAANCSFPTYTKERSPTWTFSDTVSWTHGAHSFRFNGELRLNASETKGFPNATFYTATFGTVAGTAPGTTGANDFSSSNSIAAGLPNNFKGLQTNAATNGQTLMGYLAGSLGNISSQYYLKNPNVSATPTIGDWSDFRNGEFFPSRTIQREFSAWAKDEWKITRSLSITAGLRWDYFGLPYLASGLTAGLVGGSAAAFGVSGRDFNGWMNPGLRADVTATEFVGPGSPHPDRGVYKNNYHNFGPALSFAWSLPWFGKDRTTIRGGYQITYQGGGRFGTVQGALIGTPGRTLSVSNSLQNIYLDLTTSANITPLNPNNLSVMVPVPPPNAPLQPSLITGPRNQSINVFDPNYTNPYVQNLTLSVTRTVSRNVVVDVRYIGTLSRKTYTTQNLNINNFLYNGLGEALDAVRRGDDANTGLLDQIFMGINLCTSATAPASGSCSAGSYGPINGTTQRAANQIRAGGLPASTVGNTTTPSLTSLANLDYNTLAGAIASYNYPWGSTAAPHTCAVNCTLPDPSPGVTVASVGAALRVNGLPDNFIKTNPQFNNVTYNNNSGYNNYHSLQVQATMRPIQGFSGSATYNWSKNLGLGTIFNPVNRAADYTNIGNNPGHTLRTSGTVELPIGPNKLLLGNSSGLLARALERWQLSMIYNLSSGYPTSITATTLLYGNGLPDVRHPVDFNKLKGVRWGTRSGNFLEGRYFDNGDVFVRVDDPLCATKVIATTCTLDAIAMVVPAGTPDSAPASAFGFPASDTRTLQIILQHPQLGKRGNLGNSTVISLGTWRFDANLGKTFTLAESKSLQVRLDTLNVLNHPQPGNPNLNISNFDAFGTPIPFGQITTKTGGRILQAQLRINF